MAEEKKTSTKKTTKKVTAKKDTTKKTQKVEPKTTKKVKKQLVKKENTVSFDGVDTTVDEIVTNVELKEQNEELRSDVKKYKFLMILLILLVLISVISQALKFYAEYMEENQNTKVSVLHAETLDLDDALVQELYQHVSMFKYVNAGNFMGYFYENPGATVDSISDEAKIYMGLSLVDTEEYLEGDTLVIPKKEVKEKIETIFGEGVAYKDQSLGSDNLCYLSLATFNNKDNTYEVENYNHCNSTYEAYYGTDIIRAERYSNRIELTEKVYYGEYENDGDKMLLNVYKQADPTTKNNLIVTLNATDLDEKTIVKDFSDMLYSYKYTFYLEDGEYYLNSVERISE